MANRIKYPVVDGHKQCGQCGLIKPLSVYAKARCHWSSKCDLCRKAWAKEYRQREEVKKHGREYLAAYKSDPIKRARINERSRIYKNTDKGREKRNTARRLWVAAEKQKSVNYKGGACVVCGYDKCLAALDFHHLNPQEKEGHNGGALKAHWTFERNRPELDKCVLVCVRCHREIHAGVTIL